MKENNNKKNTIAIVGFVLSFFTTFVGLILSIIGLSKSKELNDGKGFSIAGIIISSLRLVFVILVIIFALFFTKNTVKVYDFSNGLFNSQEFKDIIESNISSKTINNNDFSDKIISTSWCTQKEELEYSKFGRCLEFDTDVMRYGEPYTDYVIDASLFDKIIRISNNLYEIYGTGLIGGEEDIDFSDSKSSIVLRVEYNEENNTLRIINGKKISQDDNTYEYLSYYNNLTLYERNLESFYQ